MKHLPELIPPAFRRRDGEHFIFAGDGNYLTTERCTAVDIVATAVQIVRSSGRVIDCHSRRWQQKSRRWLALPPLMRRTILSILRRLGIW